MFVVLLTVRVSWDPEYSWWWG